LPVLSACIFFFFAGRAFMPHLGIQTDEALFAAGIYQTNAAYYKIRLFHRFIPLMLSSYNGTLKSLIYAALFQIFTPSLYTTRIPVLLMGVATIWLFFLLLRKVSGTAAATAGCVLLATDTVFLLTDEFDWGPAALAHLLLLGGMLLLYRFYETRRLSIAGWAFFLFGLAMWDKAIFIWSLAGLAAAALVVFPRVLWRLVTPKAVGVTVAAFLLGAAPLVKFNVRTRGETFRSNAVWSTDKFSSKLAMLQGTVEGGYLFGYMVREDNDGAPPRSPGTLLAKASEGVSALFGHPRRNLMLAAAGGALLLVPLLWRARTRGPRTILFALVFLLAAWLAMALNLNTGGSVHHVVLLWPFPHMLVAVAFGEAAQKFGRPGRAALAVMLCLVCASSLLVTNEYYRVMLRNGSGLVWTDAIYPLSDFLGAVKAAQVMPIDWGVFDSLRLLHGGRLPLRVGMDPLSKPALDARDRATVRKWLDTPDTIFVSHTAPNQIFDGVNERLDEIAQDGGFEREELGVFPDSHGRTIFEVFRYKPR
jgi:4-amino-4-deoxy-L-arabinose transferase-like glycosyltransferase